MAIRNPNDIVIEINRMLEQAEPLMTAECCIYRVPYEIRRLNEDAFSPKVVSIGPFHYEKHSRLQNMQKYKLVYVKEFSRRISSTISFDRLISFVQDVESKVRQCYSDTIELSSKDFVKVILVDSCFLFELFWRSYFGGWSKDDTIMLQPWLATSIRLDLLLLENQLPFSYLETLFNLAFPSNTTDPTLPSFLELTFGYFANYKKMELARQGVSISHFTDLIRTFHLQPLSGPPKSLLESKIHLPSATELVKAGVIFRKSTSPCLMDLKFSRRVLEFSRRVLEIPKLEVDDCTETLFRNIVALEQCRYPLLSHFTDYVVVMDSLINTSEDVDVLVQKGVILNRLGDTNSVANLFNSLGKNVTHVNFDSHYSKLCEDLNAFCKNPWHNMKATLRRDYCSTPWQTAASIAGIILLVLTLTQSVTSILQVVLQYKQGSSH